MLNTRHYMFPILSTLLSLSSHLWITCYDVMPLAITLCNLPFAILENHSEIDSTIDTNVQQLATALLAYKHMHHIVTFKGYVFKRPLMSCRV